MTPENATRRYCVTRTFWRGFGLWRDRLVTVLAVILVLACIQCVLTSGALPFYGAVSLHVAIVKGWLSPLAWTDESLLWFQFIAALAGAVTILIHAKSRRAPLRWLAIVAALSLPLYIFRFGAFRILYDSRMFRDTYEILFETNDGESWEFHAVVVARWWLLLWIIAAVAELVCPRSSNAETARGFEVEMKRPFSDNRYDG